MPIWLYMGVMVVLSPEIGRVIGAHTVNKETIGKINININTDKERKKILENGDEN